MGCCGFYKLVGLKMDSNPPPSYKNKNIEYHRGSKKYVPLLSGWELGVRVNFKPQLHFRMAGRPNFNSTGGLRSTYGVGAYQASSRNNAAVRPLGKADAPR